jgi:DNA-binding NarL/FixJ family response regulator
MLQTAKRSVAFAVLLVDVSSAIHENLQNVFIGFHLHHLADQQVAVPQRAPPFANFRRGHVALRQKIATQAVADLVGVESPKPRMGGKPEMNGLDAIIAIRGEFPEARIIVLTTYLGDVQVLRALKAGARAYLLKNALHKELLETIRAVHAGMKSMSAEASYQLAEHATDDALTPAEVRVLRLIAEGNANKEIAVWFSSRKVQNAMAKIRPRYLALSPVNIFHAIKFMTQTLLALCFRR